MQKDYHLSSTVKEVLAEADVVIASPSEEESCSDF